MNNITFPLKCSSPAAKSSVVSNVKYTVDSVDIVDNVDSVDSVDIDIVDTRESGHVTPTGVTTPHTSHGRGRETRGQQG